MHTPTQLLSPSKASFLIELMRDFVDHRGVGMPHEAKHSRRPRTMIATTKSMEMANTADCIWKINSEGEIRRLRGKINMNLDGVSAKDSFMLVPLMQGRCRQFMP